MMAFQVGVPVWFAVVWLTLVLGLNVTYGRRSAEVFELDPDVEEDNAIEDRQGEHVDKKEN
jgi:hypothetical protein